MPANQLNFDTIIPAVSVGKSGNYINIPAFSYTGIIWKQASELVVQYNYTTTKNFVISELPIKPAEANFIICIKFRVGYTVYRYKLWTTGTEVLPFAPQYTGQLIRKNCVIEIWNVNDGGYTVSSAADINIATSIRTLPAALSDLSDVKNTEESAALSALQIVEVAPSLPTTNLWAWYRNDNSSVINNGSTVSQWNDSSGNGRTLLTPGLDPLTSIGLDGFVSPRVNTTRYLSVTATVPILNVYAVVKHISLTNNAVIWGNGLSTNGTLKGAGVGSIKAFNSAGASVSVNAPVLSQHVVFEYSDLIDEDTKLGLDLFTATNNTGTQYDTGFATPSTVFGLGDLNASSSNDTIFYEVILFESNANDEITLATHIQILQYLAIKYGTDVFVLPASVNVDVAWLDNN